MLEFNTSDFKSRKIVKIDGVEFKVRKMGAGEELSLSEDARTLAKIGKKDPSQLTEEEQDQATALARKLIDTMVGQFDDGTADQANSKKLVYSHSFDEMKEILDKIFEEAKDETEPTEEA